MKIWDVGGTECPYCGGSPVQEVEPDWQYGYRLKGEEGGGIVMDRRQLLRGAALLGLAAAATGSGIGYAATRGGGGSAEAGPREQVAAATATPVSVPAKPTDVEEISRHPMDMPRTADYTLYDKGQYQNVVQRAGPITQEVHFNLAEVVATMVDGTTMEFWTFDSTVPGPMLRARVGDTLDFFLHNPPDAQMPHNVDFHAVTGPGGGAVPLDTPPGGSSNLRVKLLNPGIFIYHCAFPDIPDHLSHGMYGLIVVEPEGGLPPVDHEYYLMQSEFYTERGGRLAYSQLKDAGHLANSMEFGNMEQPTFVVWNGRPEAVAGHRAIGVHNDDRIETGQTVRLFVGNAGPNLVSSFHLIGEIFDKVYVEGSFDLVNRNVQTTLVPAGGATGVEFKAEVPGDYIAVDHSIFRIHKGAVASLHVEGEDRPDIFNPIKTNNLRSAGSH